MLQKISRGDVYFYNFGFDYDGSVEGKNRPCVVISNDKGNNFGTTALVAPITTRSKDSCKPWQVHYYNGNISQVILCEQIKTVNISKLYNYQGRLDTLTMRAVDEALAIELDLNIAEKELNATEFLNRLDVALDKIIARRMTSFENKISDIITKTISAKHDIKINYEELCNRLTNKSNEITNSNDTLITGINDIKLLFNKNADSLDKILSSLINLYKSIDTSSGITTAIENNKFLGKNDISSSEKQTKKSRYTLDEAKAMVEDYYNMDRAKFMSKYNLKDRTMCNNRLATMKKILKKNDIDYRNIKNKITVYNINDLTEQERKEKFSRYLKGNTTLATINSKEKIVDAEILDVKTNENTSNKRSRSNWQPRINYENVEELLAFIEECNKNSVTYICDKYGLTQKQLTNRKYLITKSLKERNIPFTMIRKSRKDV